MRGFCNMQYWITHFLCCFVFCCCCPALRIKTKRAQVHTQTHRELKQSKFKANTHKHTENIWMEQRKYFHFSCHRNCWYCLLAGSLFRVLSTNAEYITIISAISFEWMLSIESTVFYATIHVCMNGSQHTATETACSNRKKEKNQSKLGH